MLLLLMDSGMRKKFIQHFVMEFTCNVFKHLVHLFSH